MSRMVFLLEERSMKTLLDGLLPRLMPELPFICIPHEGKQDLEKISGARRMAAHLSRSGNRSRSFRAMMDGIESVFASLQKQETSTPG